MGLGFRGGMDDVGEMLGGGIGDAMDEAEEIVEAPAPPPPPPPRAPAPRAAVRHAPPVARHIGQGGGAAQPAPRGGAGGRRDAGLQRFLEMVQNDEEDEWDSDEMEDEAEGLGDRWIG